MRAPKPFAKSPCFKCPIARAVFKVIVWAARNGGVDMDPVAVAGVCKRALQEFRRGRKP